MESLLIIEITFLIIIKQLLVLERVSKILIEGGGAIIFCEFNVFDIFELEKSDRKNLFV